MIHSHRNSTTQELLDGYTPPSLPNSIVIKAQNLLFQLHFAKKLEDMKSPPGNKLHPLTGKRKGCHAVWINKKYRLIFRWDNGAHDVEIADYHDEKK